jgi:glycosyltransferase involved in cell wall biosynthesis
MKIAVYHDLSSGGAKRTLHNSLQQLRGHHHVDVFTLSCANHDFADLRQLVNRYEVSSFQPLPLVRSPFGRLNQLIRVADLVRLQAVNRNIAKVIERGDYDVAFVQPCQFENAPSLLRFLHTLPSVYFCQESLRRIYEKMPDRPYDHRLAVGQKVLNRIDPLPYFYNRSLRRRDYQNIRRANSVLVNSAFTLNTVRQAYGIEAQVSYHGVDAEFFKPLLIEKRNMLLSVGSLTPLKGFDFLIQAVSRIPKGQRPPLVIASNFQNPPERKYLIELADDLNVDIELLQYVPDNQLVELYNQAKLTLYAPIREPFGLVPLESLACSTPVVAVREGGIQETVENGRTGLLVERDPDQFAEAVMRLLLNPILASEYGRQGREHVLANWTWERAVSTLEGYLNTCMARN